MIKKFISKCRKGKSKIGLMLVLVFSMLSLFSAFGFAETETTPTLAIDFDVTSMFSWAQTMISAMMPVVYITMGVSLGFVIIRAFKSAFN